MVLISVDLPQPFGPRMATCSSAPMRRLKLSSAIFWPRMTRRLWKSSRGGGSCCSIVQVYVILNPALRPGEGRDALHSTQSERARVRLFCRNNGYRQRRVPRAGSPAAEDDS